MPIAIKPNGNEIEINDNSAKFLPEGWKLRGDKQEDTELGKVRQEFEKVTGKKPHHKMGIEKMREAIEGK